VFRCTYLCGVVWHGERNCLITQRSVVQIRLRRVDPFVLFVCGLNNPRRDASYVAELKACMKL
jgi:hypothetical protein